MGDKISYAFNWSKTQEGQDFWEQLYDEWRDLVLKRYPFADLKF